MRVYIGKWWEKMRFGCGWIWAWALFVIFSNKNFFTLPTFTTSQQNGYVDIISDYV